MTELSNCPNCGNEVKLNDKWCTKCGVKLELAAEEILCCKQCGNKLKNGDAFCPQCGTKIELPEEKPKLRYCKKCGIELNDNDKFCGECGAEVDYSSSKSRNEFGDTIPTQEWAYKQRVQICLIANIAALISIFMPFYRLPFQVLGTCNMLRIYGEVLDAGIVPFLVIIVLVLCIGGLLTSLNTQIISGPKCGMIAAGELLVFCIALYPIAADTDDILGLEFGGFVFLIATLLNVIIMTQMTISIND